MCEKTCSRIAWGASVAFAAALGLGCSHQPVSELVHPTTPVTPAVADEAGNPPLRAGDDLGQTLFDPLIPVVMRQTDDPAGPAAGVDAAWEIAVVLDGVVLRLEGDGADRAFRVETVFDAQPSTPPASRL